MIFFLSTSSCRVATKLVWFFEFPAALSITFVTFTLGFDRTTARCTERVSKSINSSQSSPFSLREQRSALSLLCSTVWRPRNGEEKRKKIWLKFVSFCFSSLKSSTEKNLEDWINAWIRVKFMVFLPLVELDDRISDRIL